jgi:hypothetical protein
LAVNGFADSVEALGIRWSDPVVRHVSAASFEVGFCVAADAVGLAQSLEAVAIALHRQR